jgi:aromatic-L-amino-acid/L-tryptophan decarboxylase
MNAEEPAAPVIAPPDMEPERMRELGYRVVDMLVARHTGLAAAPVWGGASRSELDALLREPAPETGTPFEDVLRRLAADVLPYNARIDHPRFMAFVPGAPSWPAVLGDLIASGTNIFQGTWLASSGASALELVVIDWFREWLGMGDAASGLLVSGGSAANLTAMACARLARYGAHHDAAVIYCSTETHSSVPRAARILGFTDHRVHHVPVDGKDRIDCGALREAIAAHRGCGLQPFLVVGNAGTTSTGAIDPLHELADIAAEAGAWLHVDAAYGGFAVLTSRGRAALDGIGRADSIALDPHKWLYQPFEAGCVMVRDGALLHHAFHVMPPYLQDTALPGAHEGYRGETDQRLPVNFANRGVQLTRSARVLKLWLSLQTFGVAAFRDAIDQCMDLALHAEAVIRRSDGLELLTPARLGIVCFRRRATGSAADSAAGNAARAELHDALNQAVLRGLIESGAAMISSTRVKGALALRLCVLNFRTGRDDVEAVLRWVEDFGGLAS